MVSVDGSGGRALGPPSTIYALLWRRAVRRHLIEAHEMPKTTTMFVSAALIAVTGTPLFGGESTQLLLTNTQADGLPAGIKTLDQDTGAILGFLVPEDFANNGNLWPVDAFSAGPNRTILVGQSTDDTVKQYDEFGDFVGSFISGQAVNNIRGMVPSADHSVLFTSDWAHDNVHRFDFLTGTPDPLGVDPDGEFISGDQAPPGLDLPEALAILPNGNLLVADIAQRRLLKYDSTTGAFVGYFVGDPLEDINAGTVRDIDVLANGDVVVSVDGSGDVIRTYTSGGVLDSSRTFAFNGPAGVHVLPSGEYLVASGSTFGQGRGLFRVDPGSGAILQTIDSARSYGSLELITLVDSVATCGGAGDGDVNQDGSVDGLDVGAFVGILIGGGSPPDPAFCAADVDGDDLVTQSDVMPFSQLLISQ